MDPAALLRSLTPDLGISVEPPNSHVDGIKIARVETFGAAAQAGLAVGDSIERIAGQPIDTLGSLAHLIAQLTVGDLIEISVRRAFDGREENLTVEIGHSNGPEFSNAQIREMRNEIGMKSSSEVWIENGESAAAALHKWIPKISDLTVEENKSKENRIFAPIGGARILELKNGATAHQAGLRVGDVILTVNGQRVSTAESIKKSIKKFEAGDSVKIETVSCEAIEKIYSEQGSETEKAERVLKEKRTISVELGAQNKRATVELIRNLRKMAETKSVEPEE